MKSVKLYYNPTAGEGENSKKELVQHFRDAGYGFINAVHKKDGMNGMEKEADILAVAGGDGTVRKVCLELLNMPLKHSRPIGLLALGTANNIALTLNISKDVEQVIQSWNKHRLKRFDVGRIDGLPASAFFVESFGCGVFPKLMKKMSRLPEGIADTPEKEFHTALELLLHIVRHYEAVPCTVNINDKNYSGKYILAEVMNIKSLGPRLILAPEADPGDGYFNVLLISERQRNKLIIYIEKAVQGIKARFPFKSIKAKTIKIHWEGKDVHTDDELLRKYKPAPLTIQLLDGMLDFLVEK